MFVIQYIYHNNQQMQNINIGYAKTLPEAQSIILVLESQKEHITKAYDELQSLTVDNISFSSAYDEEREKSYNDILNYCSKKYNIPKSILINHYYVLNYKYGSYYTYDLEDISDFAKFGLLL